VLRVSSLSKSFGADSVLRDVSFVLGPGRRAGLVGPNGSGKSTLLRLLAGDLSPDSGSVWIDPSSRVAYLPQYPLDELDLSVRQSLLRGAGRVGGLYERVAELERFMAGAGERLVERLMPEYAEAQEEFERLGGYELEARMEEVVAGLDLDVRDIEAPVSVLSGGNKTKLSLARLLLSGAQILLLDEPTNYLDLPAVLWLERFIEEGNRSYIIVSHDRRFLDRTVNDILELDPASHTLRQWAGTYSEYEHARRVEAEKQAEAYRDQQERIERVEEDIRRTKEQARKIETRVRSGPGADVKRRYAKKVAKKAKARERRLEKAREAQTVDKPRLTWGLHLADLGQEPIVDDRMVLEVRDLYAGYEERAVLTGVDLSIRGQDRVALLGENGSGKSTLLRCIAGDVPYQGTVRLGASVHPGVLSQEGDELPLERSVLDVLRARTEMYEDEARTYLHKFLFSGDEVSKPVRALSYGQRAKLALAILVLSDANFLVLDEPTSHMDIPALEAIEAALAAYQGPLLLVSHDRAFIERVGINRVEVLESGRLQSMESVEAYERGIEAKGRVA
jgi:ATP-binding cassette, subfamily F, member 3